ncbi:hypothetical protein ACFX13_014133 [Malus domestica]
MGCASSKLFKKEDNNGGGEYVINHVVSLTSSTYGVLNLENGQQPTKDGVAESKRAAMKSSPPPGRSGGYQRLGTHGGARRRNTHLESDEEEPEIECATSRVCRFRFEDSVQVVESDRVADEIKAIWREGE